MEHRWSEHDHSDNDGQWSHRSRCESFDVLRRNGENTRNTSESGGRVEFLCNSKRKGFGDAPRPKEFIEKRLLSSHITSLCNVVRSFG